MSMLFESSLAYIIFYSALVLLLVGYYFWSKGVQRKNAQAIQNILSELEGTMEEIKEAQIVYEKKEKEKLMAEARVSLLTRGKEFLPEDEAEEIQDEEYWVNKKYEKS